MYFTDCDVAGQPLIAHLKFVLQTTHNQMQYVCLQVFFSDLSVHFHDWHDTISHGMTL